MENETFKFKNFELTLESGGGESHLEIDNNSQKVFFSFKFSKEDIQDIINAIEKFNSGANLIQLYTGFIYKGPGLIGDINKAIINQSN